MREKAGPGCLGGCFAVIVCFLLGTTLLIIGLVNVRTRWANNEMQRAALGELVTKPAEAGLWVEVMGVPVEGSLTIWYGVPVTLLQDPESKVAVYVLLNENSPLLSARGEKLAVRGMLASFGEGGLTPPDIKLPPDVKVANYVLSEDDTPPGWLTSWGLGLLGGFILAFPLGVRYGFDR
ncbi:MAG TPA: hypothetical protein VFZ44_18380 [Pyrinomonadaceae bacterium]